MKKQELINKSNTENKGQMLQRRSIQRGPELGGNKLRDYFQQIEAESSPESFISFLTSPEFSHSLSESRKINMINCLQQNYGNRYVQRMIQTKLKIGQPNDEYEREADRVANAVMRMPEPGVQRQAEEKEEVLQTKELPGQTLQVPLDLEARVQSLRGGGQLLPASVRAFFEQRFGYDFSQVRVHTGGRATDSAKALNARAYTMGPDIVFGARQYVSETSEGKKLLAHELAHVVQQGSKAGIAKRFVNHSQFATRPDILLKSPIIIQRKVDDKDFFDYFKSCMDDLGMPTPSSLFETIGAAIATILAIDTAVATFGTKVTIGELIGAGTLGEGLIAAAAITASAYVGACIGCLGTAAGQSLSGGYGLGDALFDLIGPRPGRWIAETLGI